MGGAFTLPPIRGQTAVNASVTPEMARALVEQEEWSAKRAYAEQVQRIWQAAEVAAELGNEEAARIARELEPSVSELINMGLIAPLHAQTN